jgi:hypothetical protein
MDLPDPGDTSARRFEVEGPLSRIDRTDAALAMACSPSDGRC